ncbi:MAG: hypothetical protein ACR2MA_00325 [Egibacteraceae bacterium]
MRLGRSRAVLGALAGAGVVLLLRQRPTVRGAAADVPPAWEPTSLRRLATWVPPAPRTPGGWAAAYAWAAPLTAVGTGLGLASGTLPHVERGVLVFAPVRGLVGAVLRHRGFVATTLGHAIIAIRVPDAELLRHELAHTRQSERLGLFFAPVYLALTALYGYSRHPFERAARAAARTAETAPQQPA